MRGPCTTGCLLGPVDARGHRGTLQEVALYTDQPDVAAGRPECSSLDQRSCMTLHALKDLHNTARSEAHPMLLKPVLSAVKTAVMHLNMSVNTQLAAAHSMCGTMTTVTKLLTGTWKRQGETNEQDTCTQLAACSDETSNMVAVLSMVSSVEIHN